MKFKSVIFVLFVLGIPVVAGAYDGTNYDDLYASRCQQTVGTNEETNCLKQPGCDYQSLPMNGQDKCYLCPAGDYYRLSSSGRYTGCISCVDDEYQPFSGAGENENITWGGEYEDGIQWRWYKAGAMSEDACLFIATCPTGQYMTSTGDATADISCKPCSGVQYDDNGSNLFLLHAYESDSSILAYTGAEGSFADVVTGACNKTCPEHSHTNKSGTGCECDAGFNDATDDDGQLICKGDDVTVTLLVYACPGGADLGIQCYDNCEEKEEELVLEFGKTYSYDDVLDVVKQQHSELLSDCHDVSKLLNYIYTDSENVRNTYAFGSGEEITVPYSEGAKLMFCAAPKSFKVQYYYDNKFLFKLDTYYKAEGVTAMTATEATEHFTPDGGTMLDKWRNKNDTSQEFKVGVSVTEKCENLNLEAVEQDCAQGDYCSNWVGAACPAGATSKAKSSSIADCYLSGGVTTISGTNGSFKIPEDIRPCMQNNS